MSDPIKIVCACGCVYLLDDSAARLPRDDEEGRPRFGQFTCHCGTAYPIFLGTAVTPEKQCKIN